MFLVSYRHLFQILKYFKNHLLTSYSLGCFLQITNTYGNSCFVCPGLLRRLYGKSSTVPVYSMSGSSLCVMQVEARAAKNISKSRNHSPDLGEIGYNGTDALFQAQKRKTEVLLFSLPDASLYPLYDGNS